MPAEPPQSFIDRDRELLALERGLSHGDYAVITGQGGAGKTTLAVKLARWLVQTRRFKRAAFVCVEHLGETRAVLDSIGRQLLPQFSVAQHGDGEVLLLVRRELKDRDVLLVLDNCESLLPDLDGNPPLAAIDLKAFLDFCRDFRQAGAKLLFTIRENRQTAALEEFSDIQNDERLPGYLKPVIAKLIAILQGERNPALAGRPRTGLQLCRRTPAAP